MASTSPFPRRFSRRSVLKGCAGGAFLPSLLPSLRPGLLSGFPPGDQQLVMIQLSGGNDGLSTIVPYGDDALGRARKTTLSDPAKLLRIDDYRAFHPNLTALRDEFDEGRLAIVEGCGYPDPVRSHFKSMEVWHTAARRGRSSGDGWIGKLSAEAWGELAEPLSVVHFGGRAPYSVFSSTHPPVAVASPTAYRWFGEQDVYAQGGSAICEHEPDSEASPASGSPTSGSAGSGLHAGRDRALRLLRKTLDDAAESSALVRRAAASYQTDVEYPTSPLSGSLRDVAALIAGGVGTRVFSVQDGGFDTHTNQLTLHSRKMGTLSAAVGAFLKDLRRTEAGKNTTVVIFSEFGRRVAENGSKGHDHGKAGPILVAGGRVKGGLFGRHPSMTELDEGDLVHTTDFRSVYATLIERLFRADPTAVLGQDFERLGFL